MKSLLVALLMQLSGGLALSVGAAALRSRIGPRAAVHAGFFDQFTENMKQMTDQRVARISHVMLRTDPAALDLRTKGEAYELLTGWKEVIGDDAERFAQCARERSECESKERGGDLGYRPRGKLSRAFNDVAFVEEPGRVYGPIESDTGLHLIYLHSCGEPQGEEGPRMPWDKEE